MSGPATSSTGWSTKTPTLKELKRERRKKTTISVLLVAAPLAVSAFVAWVLISEPFDPWYAVGVLIGFMITATPRGVR